MYETIYIYNDASLSDLLLSSVSLLIPLAMLVTLALFYRSNIYAQLEKLAKNIYIIFTSFILIVFLNSLVSYIHEMIVKKDYIDKCFQEKCYKVMIGDVSHIGHDIDFSRLNVNDKNFYISHFRSLYMIKNDIRKIEIGQHIIIYYLPKYSDGIVYIGRMTEQ